MTKEEKNKFQIEGVISEIQEIFVEDFGFVPDPEAVKMAALKFYLSKLRRV